MEVNSLHFQQTSTPAAPAASRRSPLPPCHRRAVSPSAKFMRCAAALTATATPAARTTPAAIPIDGIGCILAAGPRREKASRLRSCAPVRHRFFPAPPLRACAPQIVGAPRLAPRSCSLPSEHSRSGNFKTNGNPNPNGNGNTACAVRAAPPPQRSPSLAGPAGPTSSSGHRGPAPAEAKAIARVPRSLTRQRPRSALPRCRCSVAAIGRPQAQRRDPAASPRLQRRPNFISRARH